MRLPACEVEVLEVEHQQQLSRDFPMIIQYTSPSAFKLFVHLAAHLDANADHVVNISTVRKTLALNAKTKS